MGWKEPYEFSKAECVFPAYVLEHMPTMEELPDSFRNEDHPACDIASKISSRMIDDSKIGLVPRKGMEPQKAWNHLCCIMSSFQPKHEHKIAAWGFLLDRYFTHFLVDGEVIWESDKQGEEEDGKQ